MFQCGFKVGGNGPDVGKKGGSADVGRHSCMKCLHVALSLSARCESL